MISPAASPSMEGRPEIISPAASPSMEGVI